MHLLGEGLGYPTLPNLVAEFLYTWHHPDVEQLPPLIRLPSISKVSVFHSALATFYAPSDISGMRGMTRECIHARPQWRKGSHRHDTIFVNSDPSLPGMRGLLIAHVMLFFSFQLRDVTWPCALVHWFSADDRLPDEDTGMWIVSPDKDVNGGPVLAVIHVDTILRAAHLLPVFGPRPIPVDLHFSETLDAFQTFYVNKYIDHHAYDIAF
jgi:hypothetical protein